MGVASNSADGALLSAGRTEIETYTGRFVDVANPDVATIVLEDIAHGLSLTCRYGGHTKHFYSVAEHSLLVHDLLPFAGAGAVPTPAERAWALLHDAAEAYLGDVVAPLKYALRGPDPFGASTYDELCDRMDAAILEAFCVPADITTSDRVQLCDLWALRIEARELTHTGGTNWRWAGELPYDGEKPESLHRTYGPLGFYGSHVEARYTNVVKDALQALRLAETTDTQTQPS